MKKQSDVKKVLNLIGTFNQRLAIAFSVLLHYAIFARTNFICIGFHCRIYDSLNLVVLEG